MPLMSLLADRTVTSLRSRRAPARLSALAALSLVLAVVAPLCGRPDVLFSDTFNAPDAADINQGLSSRQSGAATAGYSPVTLFGHDTDRALSLDRFALRGHALAITDAHMAGKGPASLAVQREFSDDTGPFLIKVTVNPGGSAWSGFKWGPQRDGKWPDISHGIGVIVTPAGRWSLWANNRKMKNLIGGGQVVPAGEYRVALAFSGDAASRRVSLAVNGATVLPETACDYPWTRHQLVFQSLGKNGAGPDAAPALFSALSVGKLTSKNNPAAVAASAHTGIWLEGENAGKTNFFSGRTIDVDKNGPSGGMFLRLQARKGQAEVPASPYYARYRFSVPASAAPSGGTPAKVWHLWIASTPQNATWASPLSWRIDGGDGHSLKGLRWAGPTYGNSRSKDAGWVFSWTYAGEVALTPGDHELELDVATPRADGNQYVACVDSLLITDDTTFVPSGPRPRYSTQPTFDDLVAANGGSVGAFRSKLNREMYYQLIGGTHEQVGQATSDRVMARIMARAVPAPDDRALDITDFGVHGMDRPFVVVGHNAESPEIGRAYELLARTGVDSFRTGDSCWHRLQKNPDNGGRSDTQSLHLDFKDLDFQVTSARRYGMTHLFTVGYPPDSLTMARNNKLSACNPKYYGLYRSYFEALLSRYKGKGVNYVELCNEVDAPGVWWRNSTAAHYVAEMKLLREAVDAVHPAPGEMKTVAFAATYSRDDELGGPKGGRRFVSACFNLGIDQYADAYSLHHFANLDGKDFPAYFRRELARVGSPEKPLLNTEQMCLPYPYDTPKFFARNFFLYRIPLMDYFLARDFYEGGYLKARGLFDIDWRPKVRLLAYAASVDAMRGRALVGLAHPAPGVEAYVLKYDDAYAKRHGVRAGEEYSIVLWKTDRETLKLGPDARVEPVEVRGFNGVSKAFTWELDAIPVASSSPAFSVGDEPVFIYADALPDWTLLSRDEFLAGVDAGKSEAPLPASIQ